MLNLSQKRRGDNEQANGYQHNGISGTPGIGGDRDAHGGAHAQEEDSGLRALPPYIVNQGEFLALHSNRSWLVNGEVAKRAVKIQPYPNETDGADPAFYVWFGRCKEKKGQTLRFKRDIVLSGRPGNIKLLLLKLDTANYVVNVYFKGKRVFHTVSLYDEPLPDSAAEHLHRGRNEVEIRITRLKGQSCSDFNGVFFGLEGVFYADAWVGQPEPPDYFLRGREYIHQIGFGNKGPSTIYHGTFGFSLNAGWDYHNGHHQFEVISPANYEGSFIKNCETFPPDPQFNNLYRVVCELGTMVPGARGIVNVHILFTPEYEHFDSATANPGWGVSYDVDGPWDPDYKNDTAGERVAFCDDPSTNPGCQQLP